MRMYITYAYISRVLDGSLVYIVRIDRNTGLINSMIGKMQTYAVKIHKAPLSLKPTSLSGRVDH